MISILYDKLVAALGNNIYRRSEVPNEPSISQRSFCRMSRRRAWQRLRTPNKHVDSGDIEGRQKEKN